MEPGQEWVIFVIIGGAAVFGLISALGLWLWGKAKAKLQAKGWKVND